MLLSLLIYVSLEYIMSSPWILHPKGVSNVLLFICSPISVMNVCSRMASKVRLYVLLILLMRWIVSRVSRTLGLSSIAAQRGLKGGSLHWTVGMHSTGHCHHDRTTVEVRRSIPFAEIIFIWSFCCLPVGWCKCRNFLESETPWRRRGATHRQQHLQEGIYGK